MLAAHSASLLQAANVHLRVEEAHRSLDDAYSLIVDLLGVYFALCALEYSRNAQRKILRVHLGRESVGQALALASWDGDAVARGGEVAQDDGWVGSAWHILRREEGTANDKDGDRLWLGVVHIEDCTGRVTIDQLDTKDLSVGEGGADVHLQGRRLELARVLDLFLELLDILDLRLC